MNFNYLKYNTFQILVFLLLFSSKGFSQKIPSWRTGEDLYQDSDLRLKIYMKIDSNSCNQNSTVFSEYKFKILEKSNNQPSQYITFSFDFINCNNEIFSKTISVDISDKNMGEFIESKDFQFNDVKRLYSKSSSQTTFFYNLKRSNINIHESKSKYPKPPKSISGNNQIMLGETLNLTVIGDVLSDGVKWMWYKDSCNGTYLGTGLSLNNHKPTQTTTYFVKAQDVKLDFETECKSITVKVDTKSKVADKIIGNPLICSGKSSVLTVQGGKLGLGANWVWYENNLNSKSIGSGEKIIVFPKTKTTYYVRAEGVENFTNPLSYEVDVAKNSVIANKIIGQEQVCTNEKVDLKIEGGVLGSKANWFWYNKDNAILGKGSVLSTNIFEGNQLIKVRAEGLCNKTDFLTIAINGLSSSQVSRINSYSFDKKKTRLEVEGILGDGAVWVWYVNSKRNTSNYTLLGKGKEIVVSSKKNRTYKVTAEKGTCDANSNATTFLTIGGLSSQNLKRKIDYVYYRHDQNIYKPKLFHFGASVGLFNQNNSIYFLNSSLDSIKADSSSKMDISLKGLSWGVSFHPILYEKHSSQSKNPISTSIGFFYKGGMANFGYNSYKSNIKDSIGAFKVTKFNNISYMNFGTEITLGLRGFRFYYSYEIERNNIDLNTEFLPKAVTLSDKISFKQNFNLEKNKFGFRFGRYASRNTLGLFRGVTYDLYLMSINSLYYDQILKNHYPAMGAGFSIWIQSMIKFQSEIISFSNGNNYTSARLLFNLDLFY